MKTKLFLLFCIVTLNSFAQAPPWSWARSAGGSGDDGANAITADASGNIIATGEFTVSPITFDTITLTSSSGIFIVKYNASGNVIWAKSAGHYNDKANSITSD